MKTRSSLRRGIAAFILLNFIAPMYAWDGCGHKVVATLAEEKLSAHALLAINKIFKSDPRHRTFVDAATWPDDIKQGERNDLDVKAELHKNWHYSDIPYKATANEIDHALTQVGAVTQIKAMAAFLKSKQGTSVDKADALSWLIHLVGDVHQPLHCVTVPNGTTLPNYTPPHSGDAGGNGFAVSHPSRELHALWDDAFDEPTGGPHGEGRDSSDEHVAEVAARLRANVHPENPSPSMKPEDWAKESFSYHEKAYAPPLNPASHASNPTHTVSDEYKTWLSDTAAERVILAGDRLAALLNTIFP